MEFKEILETCKALIHQSANFAPEVEVTNQSNLSEFFDSLGFLYFLLEVESEFMINGVHEHFEDRFKIANVGDVAFFVSQKLNA